MTRFIVIAVLGTLACGGDDDTGPSTPADVSGTWSASVSNMSGSGVSCTSDGATLLTLSQTGSTFSGTYSGGELTCSGPGGTTSGPIGSGLVVNGEVDGNNVSFDLDTPDFHQTGNVDGTSISGNARWRFDFGPPTGVITLNGNWAAAKQ
jgi:hypothetical protein